MIDEKNLINYIKTEINPYGRPFDGTVFEFGCKVMEYIENMEKVGEWIPCDQLPRESGDYLVWYDCGDGEEGCMVMNFDAGIGDFGYWCDEYDRDMLGFLDSEFIYFETAVAWMPLPTAYEVK